MLTQKNYPKVHWFNGATTTDVSFFMLNYGRDPMVMHMHPNHYLYFGRVKPFNALYVEMAHNSNVNTTMTLQYYNGSSWVSVVDLVDETLCFQRSGFIQFDKPDNWELQVVNGFAQYYVRISVAAEISNNTSFQGMNIVFSDDYDLEAVYPGITNYKASTETSFILRHENSRNLIVQEIRNRGLRKRPSISSKYENITAWDFLEAEEVRQWSIYLTLQNIFSSLQSKEDGLYRQKTEEYAELAEMFKAAFYISLDRDDDGILDDMESAADISTRFLVRR